MKKVFVLLTILLLSGMLGHSHSGRTDKYGGNHDRINGGYHYHNSVTFRRSIPNLENYIAKDLREDSKVKTDITKNTNEKFRVGVLVDCDDEGTKASIESHIKRELRSLQDVKIVPYGRYILKILATETLYETSGQKTGKIAIAYTLNRHYWGHLLDETFAEYKGTKNHKVAQDVLTTVGMHLVNNASPDKYQVGLSTGMTDDLAKLCKSIVVNFDTKMLEPDRNLK